MDGREQRGLAIAALCRIDRKEDHWSVPSQSGKGRYQVCYDPTNCDGSRCNCPDFEERKQPCKHIFAVQFTVQRETNADGSETITRTVTVKEKVTYRQDWPAYNQAQTTEKAKFQALLFDLCRELPDAPTTNGRPKLRTADIVFACVFKVYSTLSQRRFMTDLGEAESKGFITKTPHFNSISCPFRQSRLAFWRV